MKTKVDDYFNNGIVEAFLDGKNIISKNVMTSEENAVLIEYLADQCPEIEREINELVQKIKKNALKCDPIKLLGFLQVQSLSSMHGTTSEFQQMGFETFSVQRATEYIQSVFAASKATEPIIEGDPSETFFEISSDICSLYKKIDQYYLAIGAKMKKENSIDENLQKELLEAQMMYSVRGKRYQFIETEYYESLLTPHNGIFEDLFNITSEDIITGIKKLQYSLTQGRINDPLNALMEMIDNLEDSELCCFEQLSDEKRREGENIVNRLLGTSQNDVCTVTGWPKKFVKEFSYKQGEEETFFDHPSYPGWPIIDLPIQKRPFIEIKENYYCFDYYSFVDNFYRAMQKCIYRIAPQYNWNNIQKNTSETLTAEIFKKLLPGCTAYINNYYPKNNSLKEPYENDIIISYCDVLIIVEVKAGSFVYTAPLADYEQHIKSYKSLIEAPSNQCKRTYDYLKSNDTVLLYAEDKSEKAIINMTEIKDIFMMSITVDNINEFAAKAEKLSFIKSSQDVISIAIDDLLVYQHYFDSPLKFLHYLQQRRQAISVKQIAPNDELDHLGMYIEHNCYSMQFESITGFDSINITGYREALDTYFNSLYHKELELEKPAQKMLPLFERIISFLDKSDISVKVRLSSYLLNFSSEAKKYFADTIEYIFDRQKSTGRYIAVSTAGHRPSDLRYSCFIIQSGIINAKCNEQDDYVMASMLWNEEENRTLITLTFDSSDELINASYKEFSVDDIPAVRREELMLQGKTRAMDRLEKYKREHGAKIGRNELCPCGSGKKYKKCCGR